MGGEKYWYLVCYDIRDPKRWRKVYKKLKGRGNRVQYSIFRLNLGKTQMEALRWKLEQILDEEDDLLIIRLCRGCAQRVIDSREENNWTDPLPKFDIF